MSSVFLLTKRTGTVGSPDEAYTTVNLGVYETREDALARVERIKAANTKYPWRQVSPTWWSTGPKYDAGFFGDRPVDILLAEVQFHPAAAATG